MCSINLPHGSEARSATTSVAVSPVGSLSWPFRRVKGIWALPDPRANPILMLRLPANLASRKSTYSDLVSHNVTKRILALETCGATGSAAAFAGDELLVELTLQHDGSTSRGLVPLIGDLLRRAGWQANDVDLVAVAIGPGSFTGLRIGVTTAKTFAYASGADVLGVNSLEVIARQAPADLPSLEAVMNAHRGELFVGRFARSADERFQSVGETDLLAADAWLETLVPGTVLSGPVLAGFTTRLPEGVTTVDPGLWAPSAHGVGLVARDRYRAGERDDLWSLVPHYFRASAAEEQRARRKRPNR